MELPEIQSIVYADSIMKTVSEGPSSTKAILANNEVRILLAQAWEAGFGAARSSKTGIELAMEDDDDPVLAQERILRSHGIAV